MFLCSWRQYLIIVYCLLFVNIVHTENQNKFLIHENVFANNCIENFNRKLPNVIVLSFWYHDPGADVVVAGVLLHGLSQQHLKQAAQRHHRVAVVGGDHFLSQTNRSPEDKSVLVREKSKTQESTCVDAGLWMFFVQSETGREMFPPMERRSTLEWTVPTVPLLTSSSTRHGQNDSFLGISSFSSRHYNKTFVWFVQSNGLLRNLARHLRCLLRHAIVM